MNKFRKGTVLIGPKFIRYQSTLTSRKLHVSLHHLEGTDHGISIISLNRPEVKNAIGSLFLNQLSSCLQELKAHPTRVLIVKSDVPGVFCAGADLKERKEMTNEETDLFVQSLRNTFQELSSLHCPSISVIDGVAVGGGLELALATDFRIASRIAKMGLPETKLAIIPGAGGTQRLARIVGITLAKELTFTGRIISSEDALKAGILSYVADSAYDRALEFAREIKPQGPIALKMAKLAIDKGYNTSLQQGLKIEQVCYGNVINTNDRKEGLASFIEKREPVYNGN